MSRFARSYGAGPGHLIAHLVLLPLALWALLQIFRVDSTGRILLWLVGAVIAHDVILLPLYSLLDRAARRSVPGAAVNHVRVPAGLALLLALVYLPQLTGAGDAQYRRASGRDFDAPLERWLLATAALFLLSGIVLVARRQRVNARPRRPRRRRGP
jgi:hypothetical protein